MERHTTIKIKRLNKYPNIERRSWEAWTVKENQIFFSCLVKYKRNWKEISNIIKTKKPEQVRTYYYRLLRKISKILKSVNFTMDNRDKGNAVILMLSYWKARCENTFEECRKEFAEYLKNCVIEQLNMAEYTKTSLYQAKEIAPIRTLEPISQFTEVLKGDDDNNNDNNSDTGSETISDDETILKSDSSTESLNFNSFVSDCNYMNFNVCKSSFDSDMFYKSTIGDDFVDNYFYHDNILYSHNF